MLQNCSRCFFFFLLVVSVNLIIVFPPQLNAEKSPFQRTYAAQVLAFLTLTSILS